MPFLMLTAVVLSDQGWLDWLWPAGLLGTTGLVVIGALASRYRDLMASQNAERAGAADIPTHAPPMHTNGGPTVTGRATAIVSPALDPAMAIEQLSEREADVLRLVAAGLRNQEIADSLGISLHTVKTHPSMIFQKLAVSNRTSAVRIARELVIVD